MTEKQPSPDTSQRETSSLEAARESKGAVVITSNGLPDGYVPPSAAVQTGTGGTGGDAGTRGAVQAVDGD